MIPLPPRRFFHTRELATNEHSSKSRQGRPSPILPPQTLYQDALAEALPAWLQTISLLAQSWPTHAAPHTHNAQKQLDTVYQQLIDILAASLQQAVGSTSSGATQAQPTPHIHQLHTPEALTNLCAEKNSLLLRLQDAIAQEHAHPTNPDLSHVRRSLESQYSSCSRKTTAQTY